MSKEIGFSIPSYNESLNILALVSKIKKTFPDARIVVVDDSEKIENSKLKRSLVKDKKIKLISRLKKGGRGSAVLKGFEELLTDKNIKYFFEMDADLSHDPTEAPSFISEMNKTKSDLVIGSRYLEKSKIVDWPMKRKVLSKIINFFVNIWLGLGLNDYTNGYRLYNRSAVDYLMKIRLRESGFIALSEIAYRLKEKKFKITELPISFTDRKQGESSAGLKEYKNSIVGILRIRLLPLSTKSNAKGKF